MFLDRLSPYGFFKFVQKNTKFKDPSKNISKELNDSVGDIKKDFDDITDSIKRNLN